MKLVFQIRDDTDRQLAARCADSLQANTEWQVRVNAGMPEDPRLADMDGVLSIKKGGDEVRYAVEVKKRITPDAIASVINTLKAGARKTDLKPILITTYVREDVARALRQEQIDYVDAAGNVSISHPQFFVWFRGFRPRLAQQEKTIRLFRTTGLRALALFLSEPDAINWTYRRIAQTAGISLGSVTHTLRDLRRTGFLRAAAPGIQKLINRRKLLDSWEFGYATTLRPKLFLGSYRLIGGGAVTQLQERLTELPKPWPLVGGEWAAAVKTQYVRPERATLHLPRSISIPNLARHLRLVPDDDGNIDLLQSFGKGNVWEWPNGQGLALANPLIVHAELLHRASDDRLREVAQMLFDSHLLPVLNDDQ